QNFSRLFGRFLALLMLTSVACTAPAAFAVGEAPAAVVQKEAVGEKVNINSASADALAEMLNGVGLAKAEAIVSYRETNGPFKTIEDLKNVKGIGEATLEKNRHLISL